MTIETRIIFEAINKETGAVIARDAIITLDITRPDSIDDIGLTAANQHRLWCINSNFQRSVVN